MLSSGSSPFLHFPNASSFHKLGVNYWFNWVRSFPADSAKTKLSLGAFCFHCRSRNSSTHLGHAPPEPLAPCIPPPLHPWRRVPLLLHCVVTLASFCIRCATLVSHQQHLVLWQAPEHTERLFLFVQVQLALLFCWFKVFSFAFSKDPVRSAGKASWEVKTAMYVFVNDAGEPGDPNSNVQSHFYCGCQW